MAGTGVVGVASVVLMMLMVAMAPVANGFETAITSTRCNTDPNRGQINDPCASLYNAVCGGTYCRCHPGEVMDPHLRTCRLGDAGDHDTAVETQRGSVDQFDDLPFDYVPPGQSPTTSRTGDGQLPPTSLGDVTSIRCSYQSDPCRTMYGAVCDGSYCMCPHGTRHHPTLARCEAAPTGSRRGSFDNPHDHDGMDHSGHDHSGASTVTGAMLMLPVLAAFRVWRA